MSIKISNRNGKIIDLNPEEITKRNRELGTNEQYGRPLNIDYESLTRDIMEKFNESVKTTRDLDKLSVEVCNNKCDDTEYEYLAARLIINDLHKSTSSSMCDNINSIAQQMGNSKRYSDEFIAIINRLGSRIDVAIADDRDYKFKYFGLLTLLKSYVVRVDSTSKALPFDLPFNAMERISYMYMRVAIGIMMCTSNKDGHLVSDTKFDKNFTLACKLYDLLSTHRVSQATPTLNNSGMINCQLSSCFLMHMGDSLSEIYDTFKSGALTSKSGGGISMFLGSVRSVGAPIRSTGGHSQGLVKLIQLIEQNQEYADQGGRRRGAIAAYLHDTHPELITFIKMSIKHDNSGDQITGSANKLKYGVMLSNLFMETLIAEVQCRSNASGKSCGTTCSHEWYLFDPTFWPGLEVKFGAEFEREYYLAVEAAKKLQAENTNKKYFYQFSVTTPYTIMETMNKSLMTNGLPYILMKDWINLKSNIPLPIVCSNLCTEITIPTWSESNKQYFNNYDPEVGVCTISAIVIDNMVIKNTTTGQNQITPDYKAIIDAAYFEIVALNKIIDINLYPSIEGKRSSLNWRPLGLGFMGLADLLHKMRLKYGSPDAQKIARAVGACIYYGALKASCDLADQDGPYPRFIGSPISQGILTPDQWVKQGHLSADWQVQIEELTRGNITTDDWNTLRNRAKCGVRNSLLLSEMPTATTSLLLNKNESFEPFTSNYYTRNTLVTESVIINEYLVNELKQLGLYTQEMKNDIIRNYGSIQSIEIIPEEIRERYLTAREMHHSTISVMVKSFAPFMCQSVSTNLFLNEMDLGKFIGFIVNNYRLGLKTGVYYTHTSGISVMQTSTYTFKPQSNQLQEQTPQEQTHKKEQAPEAPKVCSRKDKSCTSCAM